MSLPSNLNDLLTAKVEPFDPSAALPAVTLMDSIDQMNRKTAEARKVLRNGGTIEDFLVASKELGRNDDIEKLRDAFMGHIERKKE